MAARVWNFRFLIEVAHAEDVGARFDGVLLTTIAATHYANFASRKARAGGSRRYKV